MVTLKARNEQQSGTRVMSNPIDRATQWRGRVHQFALLIAIPASLALVLVTKSAKSRAAATIYGVSLVASYAASSLYNRRLTTAKFRPWMRWLDHSMIYVFIAGSYTPICLLIAPSPWGAIALGVIWTAAVLGAGIKFTTLRSKPGVGMALYLLMGWAAVLILPLLVSRMSRTSLTLLIAGGLLYTGGTVVVYRKAPNPIAKLFGYHEVWHSFVAAASVCHFAMQWLILSGR
jgi:hemolysin III